MSTETMTQSRPGLFSRQWRTTLSKLAFWLLVTVTVLSGLVVLLITVFAGSPSRDSVTLLVSAAIATVIAAIAFRWTPLITVVTSAVIFYQVVTEPFVIEHLTSPKAQNGFGTFIGDVIIICCLIIIFGASIGATVQNIRMGSRKAPRWLPSFLSAVIGLGVGALIIGTLSLPPAAANTGSAFVNGVPAVHMGPGSFLQTSVTIPKGSKLVLVDDSSAVHILVNGSWQNGVARPDRETGAPGINNIQVSGNSVQVGPFTIAGTYHIYCSVHQGMNLTIIVQ